MSKNNKKIKPSYLLWKIYGVNFWEISYSCVLNIDSGVLPRVLANPFYARCDDLRKFDLDVLRKAPGKKKFLEIFAK